MRSPASNFPTPFAVIDAFDIRTIESRPLCRFTTIQTVGGVLSIARRDFVRAKRSISRTTPLHACFPSDGAFPNAIGANAQRISIFSAQPVFKRSSCVCTALIPSQPGRAHAPATVIKVNIVPSVARIRDGQGFRSLASRGHYVGKA